MRKIIVALLASCAIMSVSTVMAGGKNSNTGDVNAKHNSGQIAIVNQSGHSNHSSVNQATSGNNGLIQQGGKKNTATADSSDNSTNTKILIDQGKHSTVGNVNIGVPIP